MLKQLCVERTLCKAQIFGFPQLCSVYSLINYMYWLTGVGILLKAQ